MKIAIDIVSGDNPAAELLPGALQGAKDTGVELLLVGGREELEKALAKEGGERPEIIDAEDVIGMEESPVRALAKKPKASVAVAASLVVEGKADIFLTPGNTGAGLVVASQKLGRLPGVMRPALAACLANIAGEPTVFLDVGASADGNPRHLAQFAVMGAAYAQGVLGIAKPRVALLNNGTEPGKGNELYKQAYQEIEKSGLDFQGNIEGFDLFSGKTDVVVTDGFTGNVLAKSIAGVTLATLGRLEKSLGKKEDFVQAAAPLKEQAAQRGGVPLLGVKGGCLILHGRADAEDTALAIHMAAKMVEGKVAEIIEGKLREYGLVSES